MRDASGIFLPEITFSCGQRLSTWACHTSGMKKIKIRFIRAVRLQAPRHSLVFQFAAFGEEPDRGATPHAPRRKQDGRRNVRQLLDCGAGPSGSASRKLPPVPREESLRQFRNRPASPLTPIFLAVSAISG